MAQVPVRVTFTDYREAILARLGQLPADEVHHYETEALVDTGAMPCVIPPEVAGRLGLLRLQRTEARYGNDQVEKMVSPKSLPSRLLWAVRHTKMQ